MSRKGPDKDERGSRRILSLPCYTLRDVDFAPFFRIERRSVFLTPEVIRYFNDILPIITEVAGGIKSLIERTHEVERMLDSDKKEQAKLALQESLQQFVLEINVRLREMIANVINRNQFIESATDEKVGEFLRKLNVKSKEEIRKLVQKIIRIALGLKLFSSQRKIALSARVNIGQFSVFLTKNGPLSMGKMRDILRVIVNTAAERGMLSQLEAEVIGEKTS